MLHSLPCIYQIIHIRGGKRSPSFRRSMQNINFNPNLTLGSILPFVPTNSPCSRAVLTSLTPENKKLKNKQKRRRKKKQTTIAKMKLNRSYYFHLVALGRTAAALSLSLSLSLSLPVHTPSSPSSLLLPRQCSGERDFPWNHFTIWHNDCILNGAIGTSKLLLFKFSNGK